MTQFDLTLQEDHLAQLRELLRRDDGTEASAYVLCGSTRIQSDPWDRTSRQRLTTHEVLAVPPEDRVSASGDHVTWSTNSYVRLLKRAQAEGLVVGIVHTHPRGPDQFSDQDDRNERELHRLAQNRNGAGTRLLSILLAGDSAIRARLWVDYATALPHHTLRIVGRHLVIHREVNKVVSEVFSRQALAFGDALNHQLQHLKVGVVGCGGTGSAVATLLARLGVGNLLLIDDDRVEATNLNRLHGARRSDADAMRPKVDVLAAEITGWSIGTRVVPIQAWAGDPLCRDALRSCDVLFGCTDDHDGRLFLNRFAYFYLTPVIDVGLAIDPAMESGFRELSGRVTVLSPGAPCLICRGVVDPVTAREEALKRAQPEQYERQKREAYVRGSGNPAPGVVTFTTETACMAVNELIQGLIGYRGPEGWIWNQTRRFDRFVDRRPGAHQSPDCPICVDRMYWGRGDVDPFLDRVG